MDTNDVKQGAGKLLKGCGCLSIGFVILMIIVGIFVDDEAKIFIYCAVLSGFRILQILCLQ